MKASFRNGCKIVGFGEDYHKIRTFLCNLKNPNYSYGRWDWMMKHGDLNESELNQIGVWEVDHQIVAATLYDGELGQSHFCVQDHHEYLKKEMLLYARDYLRKGDTYQALIHDNDQHFQAIAFDLGFIPTVEKECDARFVANDNAFSYQLPSGFQITDMEKTCDLYQYGEVLWKGFDHEKEGEFSPSKQQLKYYEDEFNGPYINKSIKIVVVAASGEFASYCGMWYDPRSEYAIVEPVATVPKYRGLGLGKAAVLEGIRRCFKLGAKSAFVGSSQQFYYNIGFIPYGNATFWRDSH